MFVVAHKLSTSEAEYCPGEQKVTQNPNFIFGGYP
jgi:hypothetical protein